MLHQVFTELFEDGISLARRTEMKRIRRNTTAVVRRRKKVVKMKKKTKYRRRIKARRAAWRCLIEETGYQLTVVA